MHEFDPIVASLARQAVEESSAAVKAVRKKLEEQQEKSREAYEKFHNNLALFSGGTIALSVTFLGYLKSLPNRVVSCPKVLIASWIVLLICVLTSLFYSFFYSHYAHFIMSGEYLGTLEKSYRTGASAIENLEVLGLTTEEEKLIS